jgi:uncharacterized protein YceK
MRQLVMLLAALIFGGCASSGYVTQAGPWSEPVVKGKTGMPEHRDNVWTQVGVCRYGPTLPYPTIAKDLCI